jgi:hypothetical protein
LTQNYLKISQLQKGPQWSSADEQHYQTVERQYQAAMAPDPPNPPRPQQPTAEELHHQLLSIFNLCISDECHQYLLAIKNGNSARHRVANFDFNAHMVDIIAGPLLANDELTDRLVTILIEWMGNGLIRRHQDYNYTISGWVPEAVGFALQWLHPTKSSAEIFHMVNAAPTVHSAEDMQEVQQQMLKIVDKQGQKKKISTKTNDFNQHQHYQDRMQKRGKADDEVLTAKL